MSAEANGFNWIPFFKELAEKLLDYEDKQPELVDILHRIGIDKGLKDEDESGEIELREIDPFTFFSLFMKYKKDSNRAELFAKLKQEMNLQSKVPAAFNGVPTAQPLKAWLFAYKKKRKPSDIPTLWMLFKQALKNNIDGSVFQEALNIKQVARAKLTQNLFYINPEEFLPIDAQTTPFLKSKGIDSKFNTYKEYQSLLQTVKERFPEPFYEISREAWESNQRPSGSVYQSLIEDYKSLVREDGNEEELYKWRAIQHFQDTFNLEAEDFAANLADAISKQHNLVYHRATMFIKWAARDYPERVRAMFRNLLDEAQPLPGRFKAFKAEAEAIVQDMIAKEGRENIGDFQDERTLAFYLTMAHPDKYYLYKDNIYRSFAQLLGVKPAPAGEKYFHYTELAEGLRREIEKDQELLKLSRSTLMDDCYRGEQTHILVQDILYRVLVQKSGQQETDEDEEVLETEEPVIMKTTHPLNQILYGPPGTGKTYQTKELAVAIIEGLSPEEVKREYHENRKGLSKQYERYVEEGRIGFVTFHQSFSYEDFVEGIKPVMNNSLEGEEGSRKEGEKEELAYEIQDGLFKRMAEQAASYEVYARQDEGLKFNFEYMPDLENIYVFKMSLGRPGSGEDEEVYRYCIENDCVATELGGDIDFSDAESEKEVLRKFQEAGVDASNYETFAIKCLRVWMKKGDIIFISDGNTRFKAIAVVDGDYYFDPNTDSRYKQFRKVRWLLEDVNIPVREVYKKNFSGQVAYMMFRNQVRKEFFQQPQQQKPEAKNHVLIIDEINRGNVANTFGELITLIEPDKRQGNEEALKVQLPYSKSEFSVPPNLYLIGTMNTADRSVEALDTALRRRFSFVPVYPDPGLLKGANKRLAGEIDLVKMLTTINARLEKLLNRDHTIGHSYFMGLAHADHPLEALRMIFYNKVLPLLQEYFYGDYDKIGMVLGDGFIRERGGKVLFHRKFRGLDMDFEDKKVYEFTDPGAWTAETFQSIYEEA